jgi:CRP-like cAMP-binding protein
LSATTRRRLADQAQLKRLAPGELLYSPDSREDCVYYLLAGELDLYWRQMSVERVKAGSVRASQAFDVQARRRVTVSAAGTAIVARFNRTLLMRELGDEFAQHVPDAIDVAELAERPAADWMARLVGTKLFAQLPSTHIQRLFSALQPVTGTAGQTLIEQGEAPLWYYIVAEGQCAMSRTVQPDGRVLALENLGPGDCFGELPLITGRPWDVRVTWLSNGIAMRLSEVVFRGLLCAPLLQALSPQQALAARATGQRWKDAMAIGVLMNTRGLIGLVVLNIGLDLGVISHTVFTMMVLMALVTTVMTSPLLAMLQRREEQLTAPESVAKGL